MKKPKKRLESFLLAWLKRHTGLPLFDSRLRLGSSQECKESKIYFYVNEAELPSKSQLKKVLEVLVQHPLFEVVFAFYNGSPERVKELEGQLEELIASEQDLHLVQSPAK